MTALRVFALRWGEEAVIREADGRGDVIVYRETFDSESFDSIPPRVPLQRFHYGSEPIGWATLAVGPDGLLGTAELIDTVRARDSEAEIRAELASRASISFQIDPKRDVWKSPPRGRAGALPSVLRRNVTLREVSIVGQGAYPSAHVELFDPAHEAHKASERELAPMRAQLDREAAERRAMSRALMDWDPGPPPIPAAPEPVDLGRPAASDRVLVRRGMGVQW